MSQFDDARGDLFDEDLSQQNQPVNIQPPPEKRPSLNIEEVQKPKPKLMSMQQPRVQQKTYNQTNNQSKDIVSQVLRQGKEQTKSLLELDPQQQKAQLRKLIEQSKGRIVKYVPGQFSRFATIQEKSIQSMETYIRLITQQASYSHLSKIKMLMKQARNFQKQSKQQKVLKTIVDENNLLIALQDPIDFFAKNSIAGKNIKFKTFKQLSQNFFRFMKVSKQFALVQGKMIQRAKLNLQSAFRHTNDQVLIPTTSSNVYIKVGKGLLPQKRVLKNGKFVGMESLANFDQNTKKVIYDMVKLFLAKKGLLTEQTKKIIESQIGQVQKTTIKQNLLEKKQ